MPKARTNLEQQAYEERIGLLQQTLLQEALPREAVTKRSGKDSVCQLSNLNLKILRHLIQIKP
jgi:hypothetical protein